MAKPARTATRPLTLVAATLAVAATVAASLSLDKPDSPTADPAPAPQKHPVHIAKPGTPRVLAGHNNPDGTPATVACATCHSTRTPNTANKASTDLDEFHLGLTFKHGTLSCLSCHNADDYDSLKLADGTPLEFSESMTLCAQCHGPQFRDYQHGSHGGMTGYWDLTKGPRTRNHCTTCHDAHAPAYPQLTPVFKPSDVAKPAH